MIVLSVLHTVLKIRNFLFSLELCILQRSKENRIDYVTLSGTEIINGFPFVWLKKKLFAFYWHKAACNGKLPSGSRIDSTLITTGFDNWKKAKGKFRAHKKSLVHRDALFAYKSCNQPPITAQMSHKVLREQKCHREFLMTELSSLQYLIRQGLAVRGHIEGEGNLQQLLKCRSD